MIREPVVAGQFYPGGKHALQEELNRAFADIHIPKLGKVQGAIVPHAGYMYSGTCAAHSFQAVKQSGTYDTFLILGFSHTGMGAAELVTSGCDWRTPLGVATLDADFSSRLLSIGVTVDERAHSHEHSIEVQLPFLQHLYEKVSFVPISVAPHIACERWGSTIAEVIVKTKKKICVLASSDFTHYGIGYGYVPFGKNVKENLKALDMGAVDFLRKCDSKGFLSYIEKTGATICGAAPIALLTEIMKNLGHQKGELLHYVTSGDLTGDFSHSVSYVSLVFT